MSDERFDFIVKSSPSTDRPVTNLEPELKPKRIAAVYRWITAFQTLWRYDRCVFLKAPALLTYRGTKTFLVSPFHLDSGGNFIEAKTFLAATSNISVSNIEFSTQRRNALFPAGNDHFIKKMRSKELEQFHQTNPSHHPALSRPLSTPVKLDKLQAYLDGYPARSKQYVIFRPTMLFQPLIILWQSTISSTKRFNKAE